MSIGIGIWTMQRRGGSAAPDAPTNLAATVYDDDRIDLTWDVVTGADSYKVYYGTDGVTFGSSTTSATNSKSVTGLDANTKYYYYVVSVKGSTESTASSTVDATTYHTEVGVYITGLTTALSTKQKTDLNTFINGIKLDWEITNLSDYLDFMHIYAGETVESSKRNIVKNAHHATITSTRKFIPFIGFYGGGSHYVNTGFNISTGTRYTKINNSFGVYSRNNMVGNYVDIGIFSGTNSFSTVWGKHSNTNAYYNNNHTVNLSVANPSTTEGLLVSSRSADNRVDYFVNGVSEGNSNQASTTLLNGNLFTAVENKAGSPGTNYSHRHYAMDFAGISLNATQLLALKTRFETYLWEVTRNNREMVLEKGQTYNGWAADAIAAPSVCWDGTQYVMTVSLWSIANDGWASAFFTSSDLKNWSYINNSLIQPNPVSSILANAGIAWFNSYYWFVFQDQGNPCSLWKSQNLVNWTVVADDLVAAGYDPSINVNPYNNKLEIWYINTGTRDIYMIDSSDGASWSAATMMLVKNTIYLNNFGAPTVFYIDNVRYILVDAAIVSGDRRVMLYHSLSMDTTWICSGYVLFQNEEEDWEHEQVSDCGCIIADLNDGKGSIPRVLYVGSDNNSPTDNTNSSIALYNLTWESY